MASQHVWNPYWHNYPKVSNQRYTKSVTFDPVPNSASPAASRSTTGKPRMSKIPVRKSALKKSASFCGPIPPKKEEETPTPKDHRKRRSQVLHSPSRNLRPKTLFPGIKTSPRKISLCTATPNLRKSKSMPVINEVSRRGDNVLKRSSCSKSRESIQNLDCCAHNVCCTIHKNPKCTRYMSQTRSSSAKVARVVKEPRSRSRFSQIPRRTISSETLSSMSQCSVGGRRATTSPDGSDTNYFRINISGNEGINIGGNEGQNQWTTKQQVSPAVYDNYKAAGHPVYEATPVEDHVYTVHEASNQQISVQSCSKQKYSSANTKWNNNNIVGDAGTFPITLPPVVTTEGSIKPEQEYIKQQKDQTTTDISTCGDCRQSVLTAEVLGIRTVGMAYVVTEDMIKALGQKMSHTVGHHHAKEESRGRYTEQSSSYSTEKKREQSSSLKRDSTTTGDQETIKYHRSWKERNAADALHRGRSVSSKESTGFVSYDQQHYQTNQQAGIDYGDELEHSKPTHRSIDQSQDPSVGDMHGYQSYHTVQGGPPEDRSNLQEQHGMEYHHFSGSNHTSLYQQDKYSSYPQDAVKQLSGDQEGDLVHSGNWDEHSRPIHHSIDQSQDHSYNHVAPSQDHSAVHLQNYSAVPSQDISYNDNIQSQDVQSKPRETFPSTNTETTYCDDCTLSTGLLRQPSTTMEAGLSQVSYQFLNPRSNSRSLGTTAGQGSPHWYTFTADTVKHDLNYPHGVIPELQQSSNYSQGIIVPELQVSNTTSSYSTKSTSDRTQKNRTSTTASDTNKSAQTESTDSTTTTVAQTKSTDNARTRKSQTQSVDITARTVQTKSTDNKTRTRATSTNFIKTKSASTSPTVPEESGKTLPSSTTSLTANTDDLLTRQLTKRSTSISKWSEKNSSIWSGKDSTDELITRRLSKRSPSKSQRSLPQQPSQTSLPQQPSQSSLPQQQSLCCGEDHGPRSWCSRNFLYDNLKNII
eukprot:sb/3461664/